MHIKVASFFGLTSGELLGPVYIQFRLGLLYKFLCFIHLGIAICTRNFLVSFAVTLNTEIYAITLNIESQVYLFFLNLFGNREDQALQNPVMK